MAFDRKKADRAVKFIENIRWAGEKIDLQDWQREHIRELFGRVDEKGKRVYRVAYWEWPKKNGKTTIAAAISLYMLFADGESGAELYSAATDKDQAKIVWKIAREMVLNTPALEKRAKVIDYKSEIHFGSNVFEVADRDAASRHGINPSFVVCDEIHEWKSRDLWSVFRRSMGTREEPLILAITNSGNDRSTLCWELHDYARKVSQGVLDDSTWHVAIYSASKEDEAESEIDWLDEGLWHEANPGLGTFKSLESMRDEAREARESPSAQNDFKRFHLGIWTQASTRFLDGDAWDLCKADYSVEELRGMPCYTGVDLASTTDLAAVVHVFGEPDDFYVVPRFYCPRDTITKRSRDDNVPYLGWSQHDHLTATPGPAIDYTQIESDILEDDSKFGIARVGFDPWQALQMSQRLEAQGVEVVGIRQGYKSLSAATKFLDVAVRKGSLKHDGNPVLRWSVDNLVVRQDPAGNIKPDKEKSTEKIDPMTALIMAIDCMMRHSEVQTYGDLKFL